jgi:Tol biopolymer transport system component
MHRVRVLSPIAAIFVAMVLFAGGDVSPSAGAAPGDEGVIAFSTGSGGTAAIQTILPDGTGQTPLISGATSPAWSPDGSKIAFYQSGQIAIADYDGSNPTPVAAGGGTFTWSPDGRKIVLVRDDPASQDIGVQDIWVHDLGTGTEQKITPAGLYFPNSFAWSPDGHSILFAASLSPTDTTPSYDLYTIPAGGGASADVTNTPNVVELGADWSPNGSQIAFAGLSPGTGGTYEIFVMNANGGDAHEVSASSAGAGQHAFHPSWSPDGARLAYQRGTEVRLVDANGGDDTFLVSGGGPDWGRAPPPLQVEFTQAIQELQTIGELQASLAASGQPPVPIVAGRAAVMRVYFADVDQTANYHIEVTGEISKSESVTISPGCAPKDRREAKPGCPSQDYYFTPPAGDWQVRLEVTDKSDGRVVLDETFHFASVDTDGLIIKYIPVCVQPSPGATAVCPGNFIDTNAPDLMRKIYPTADDELVYEHLAVPNIVLPSPVTDATALVADLWLRYGLMSMGGFVADQLAGWLPAGGAPGLAGISDPVWLGSTGRVSFETDTSSADALDVEHTLAHEIGHNLGLRHTNLSDGCGAVDPGTDWPYPDSTVQEVGFDVAAHKIMPATKKDLMTYCTPPGSNIWISPFTYNKLINGNFNPQSLVAAPAGQGPSQYLLVEGGAQADGSAASIDSAYVITSNTPAEPSKPDGNYCLHFSGGSDYCFTLEFEEHRSHQPIEFESFALRAPLPPGTTSVTLMHGNTQLDSLTSSAAAPAVNITQPQNGWSGEQTISWTGSDGDGDPLKYAVLYSPDNGATWLPLAVDITDASLTLDTTQLEGMQLLVRVLASDGLQTTIATSAPIALLNSAHRTWGDADCSGAVQPLDALDGLAAKAGVALTQTVPGCPDIQSAISVSGVSGQWGDFDCSGAVDGGDAALILKLTAKLPASPPDGCPRIGTKVVLGQG